MSLSRLALRLAAVEALCPAAVASTGPWPTWAGSEVFDSSTIPLSDADAWKEFVAQVEGRPVVNVYTEEHETSPIDGADYPAEIEMVDLVVEIFVAAGSSVDVTTMDGTPMRVGDLDVAITSAQHEAILDMLEAQIRNLLDPHRQSTPKPYADIAYELHHVKSVPVRDAVDRLSRQAARTLTFKLKVKASLPYGSPEVGVDPAIAGLPEPLLTVAKALDPQSPAGQLVRQIAQGQPGAPILTPLDDVRVYSSVNRGEAPTASNADMTSDVPL